MDIPIIFDRSVPGRRGVVLPHPDVPPWHEATALPDALRRRTPLDLPEVSELDVVRHYTRLSQLNWAVDTGLYPLGSCTMKYNPRIAERVAARPGFARVHPRQPDATVQGWLELLAMLEQSLAAITGMDAISLQPAAGAHGELVGMLIVHAYHHHRGDDARTTMLVPDSAHGTNPASATMAGFRVVEVPSNRRGSVDVEALRRLVGPDTAGLMLTNPNTLGLFEDQILEIAAVVHDAGGLLYYDGANMNAILGRVRPGDMGFDVVHLNLHKTFATPHGGGGPGSGPVGVRAFLAPYLPIPRLVHDGERNEWAWRDDFPLSIGRVRAHYGNVAVALKALVYILMQGPDGLKAVADAAVLNANYLLARLRDRFQPAFDRPVMHEFVLDLTAQRRRGATALDVAKRVIDYGFYPPTVYFPLVVKEAWMVEPTETESKETLDRFADALLAIDDEIDRMLDQVRTAPHSTPVRRLDEASAARHPDLGWPGSTRRTGA